MKTPPERSKTVPIFIFIFLALVLALASCVMPKEAREREVRAHKFHVQNRELNLRCSVCDTYRHKMVKDYWK
jgi:hypothetical protein